MVTLIRVVGLGLSMKRFLTDCAGVFAVVLLISLGACGAKTSAPTKAVDTTLAPSAAPAPAPAPASAPSAPSSGVSSNQAPEKYLHARARLLAAGFAPAAIPRGGEFDQCGISGEVALCKRFPELVNCEGMGPSSGSCRMAFVAPDGRLFVVAAFGWEKPSTMVLTGSSWANSEDTQHIKNILAGKPEFAN